MALYRRSPSNAVQCERAIKQNMLSSIIGHEKVKTKVRLGYVRYLFTIERVRRTSGVPARDACKIGERVK